MNAGRRFVQRLNAEWKDADVAQAQRMNETCVLADNRVRICWSRCCVWLGLESGPVRIVEGARYELLTVRGTG
ncbi:hypothetical protein HMPREF1980_00363 [Actinomyces sp. oral taxon 172 str. F0311]|nr:hypothetical protein HMPREF1980_00363 [Actinomyces sp. oral taxon 172 str. F0311]